MSFFASLLAEAKTGKPTTPARAPTPVVEPTTTTTPYPDYEDEPPAKKMSLDDLFAAEIEIERAAGGYVDESEEDYEDYEAFHDNASVSAGRDEARISPVGEADAAGGVEPGLKHEGKRIEGGGPRAGSKRGSPEVEELEEKSGTKKVKTEEDEEDEELWAELFGEEPEDEGVEEEGWDTEGWETVTEAGWDSEGWETVDEDEE